MEKNQPLSSGNLCLKVETQLLPQLPFCSCPVQEQRQVWKVKAPAPLGATGPPEGSGPQAVSGQGCSEGQRP
jgi:hypothetical protein